MVNVDNILKKLSLEQKISLCSGENFWTTKALSEHGVPALFMCDGPHGLRKQASAADMIGVNKSIPATCFPTAVTTGASWDCDLLEEIGTAIGREGLTEGVGLVLGPGANIKRNPLCGRNFEYISEDPYHSGKMAAAMIRGLQKNGNAASLKHFAANSQEFSRFNSDSVMDERTLREIYLAGFEIAVKEGAPDTVMCAYNKINGKHCSDNRTLLTDILREEWGFNGMVVTDWGAMNDRIEGFKAGCDLNMPGGSEYMEKECLEAVKSGKLSEEDVNKSAHRVLTLMAKAAENLEQKTQCDKEAHHDLARRAAEQGAVLLKNEEEILPLHENEKIAIIGIMAKKPRYQGSGSSHINPTKISAALDFLPNTLYAPGCNEDGTTTSELIAEAVEAAKNKSVAIVFAGLPDMYESEGFDRDNMQMPEGHNKMIEAVAAANPNTVVVLSCGSVVECPWESKVKAILYMGLPGQAGGEAIVNLLYGKANPSGRLTETWPIKYEDCPSSDCYANKDGQYREGIYVGYRYYDKAEKPVRWPFGFGLSYTNFSYSNLRIMGDTVLVDVKNTGKQAGGEVVQLYVLPKTLGEYRPVKELKGFQKIFLAPEEEQTVEFLLDKRSFAVWQEGWKTPGGVYTIQIGDCHAELELDTPQIKLQRGDWYDMPKGKPSQKQWEALLGRSYTEKPLEKGQFTMDNSVMEMKDFSFIMKIMFKVVEKVIAKNIDGGKDYSNPEFRMMILSSVGAPLRSMQINNGIKGGLFQGLLDMANGHFFRGIGKMIKG